MERAAGKTTKGVGVVGWVAPRAEPGTRLCQNPKIRYTLAHPIAIPPLLELRTVMGHIQGAHRHEMLRFPERLDDDSSAEPPVRFREACVDALARATRGCQRVTAAATGRPAYHPGALLKLYLYGYLYRLRSSRRLEQATHRPSAWMGLLKQRRPDQKTMATCRRDHYKALRQVCRACTLWGQQRDLFAGALVAIEGSQGKAVPAQERPCTQSQRHRLLPQSEAQIAVYLQARERGETAEEQGTAGGARAEPLHATMAERKERQLLSQAFQEQRLARGEAQRARTAPDRRAMQRGQGRGPAVCYNVPTAVAAKPRRSLACEVTNETSDRAWLSPMALAATAVLERPCAVVAERGSYSGDDVQACLEAGLTPSVARPLTSAHKKLGRFSTDDVP